MGNLEVTSSAIQNEIVNIDDPTAVLEPLMRRIVREELANFLEQSNSFILPQDSPLYDDMVSIRERAKTGKVELLEYKEVFDA